MNFFETSAKANQNITEVFNYLTKEIMKANEGKTQSQGEKLKKTDGKKSKSGIVNHFIQLYKVFIKN